MSEPAPFEHDAVQLECDMIADIQLGKRWCGACSKHHALDDCDDDSYRLGHVEW